MKSSKKLLQNNNEHIKNFILTQIYLSFMNKVSCTYCHTPDIYINRIAQFCKLVKKML